MSVNLRSQTLLTVITIDSEAVALVMALYLRFGPDIIKSIWNGLLGYVTTDGNG